ncbi:hypothetical protein FKM82_010764 [Ascaphus truei]
MPRPFCSLLFLNCTFQAVSKTQEFCEVLSHLPLTAESHCSFPSMSWQTTLLLHQLQIYPLYLHYFLFTPYPLPCCILSYSAAIVPTTFIPLAP